MNKTTDDRNQNIPNNLWGWFRGDSRTPANIRHILARGRSLYMCIVLIDDYRLVSNYQLLNRHIL